MVLKGCGEVNKEKRGSNKYVFGWGWGELWFDFLFVEGVVVWFWV